MNDPGPKPTAEEQEALSAAGDILEAAEAPPPAPRDPGPAGERFEARDLGTILDEALDRMERRVVGDERPIPLPWSNVSAALGGGLWGGTLVTLLGDTGSGKTQWALQTAVHAAEYGVPVCYVGPDSGIDQIAARLLSVKAGHKWSDLYVGRSEKETIDTLRMGYAQAMKALPFHIIGGGSRPDQAPEVRRIAEWMRGRYEEAKTGTRPMLLVLDFVQLAAGVSRDDVRDVMARTAREGRETARDLDAVVLLVSTTSREMRPDADETIGIHRDRRQPPKLGRGNPARLVLGNKDEGDAERESDTVIVLAQEPWKGGRTLNGGTKVWCAVAKNRAGSRAWCALRFNGSSFDMDLDTAVPAVGEATSPEEEEKPALRGMDEE